MRLHVIRGSCRGWSVPLGRHFDFIITMSGLAEVTRISGGSRVRSEHLKACRRLVQVVRVRFDRRDECRRLVQIGRVRFDHRKACRKVVEVRRVCFEHLKACRRLVEVWRVRVVSAAKCIGGL